MRGSRGFSLVELAVVLAIVGLLLGSLMYTLGAQVEQRNFEETRRRVDLAREALLTFAATRGRLPCPARSANTTSPSTVAGDEVWEDTGVASTSGICRGDTVADAYGGSNGAVVLGLLPARTLGLQNVDAAGFAIDAWGNRLRYAVSGASPYNCTPPANPPTPFPATPHFTNKINLQSNGITCQPNDLIICKSATGITSTTCGGAANQIMSQNLVTAIVFSTGKNGATGGTSADEAANLNGDRVFVYHAPTSSENAGGEFDDLMTWITHGELYGRMIAAGTLP